MRKQLSGISPKRCIDCDRMYPLGFAVYITLELTAPMPKYVAFLRAINVTGRFIKMNDLAAAFHKLWHLDARTYINSGNVVFSSSMRSGTKLEQSLEDQLEPQLGFRSEVFERTAIEVKEIASKAQSLSQQSGTDSDVKVCFLKATLNQSNAEALMELKTTADDFHIGGREIYWLCRTKQSESKFSNAVLERKLKMQSTLRRVSMLNGLAGEV
jgi:uncharacterized protein (DUF1697 family)